MNARLCRMRSSPCAPSTSSTPPRATPIADAFEAEGQALVDELRPARVVALDHRRTEARAALEILLEGFVAGEEVGGMDDEQARPEQTRNARGTLQKLAARPRREGL